MTAEPLDPRYVRFRDGWSSWVIGKPQSPLLRWAPWSVGSKWVAYGTDEWRYDDFGVKGPASPLSFLYRSIQPAEFVWIWGAGYPGSRLPDLWRQIDTMYARLSAAYPGAVWNPYDGTWRDLEPVSPHRAPSRPSPPRDPHPEFTRRALQLKRDYEAGLITDDIYKQRLLELTREYL
jgi:hypothetical protein